MCLSLSLLPAPKCSPWHGVWHPNEQVSLGSCTGWIRHISHGVCGDQGVSGCVPEVCLSLPGPIMQVELGSHQGDPVLGLVEATKTRPKPCVHCIHAYTLDLSLRPEERFIKYATFPPSWCKRPHTLYLHFPYLLYSAVVDLHVLRIDILTGTS